MAEEEDVIEVTDKQIFDDALGTTPEPAPESEPVVESKTDKTGRLHDEKGRFAPKDDVKLPPQEASKVADQVVAEHLDSKAALAKPEETHRVPLRELLDEREKRQQMANELAQIKAWQQQVVAAQRQAAMRAQQPQEPPNIIDNPDTYLTQRVVAPMQQWGQQQIRQVKDQISYEMAKMQPGGEQAVSEALAEIKKIGATPEMQFAYQQIMNSGHPYGALIAWHKEHKNRQMIGADPNAWFEKQLEEKKKDPAFQAEIVKLIQGQQPGRPPVVNLPPSLSSVPAAAGRAEEQGDLSDASLFNHAIR